MSARSRIVANWAIPRFGAWSRILFRYASEAQAQDHATQTAQRLTQLIPQHDPNAEIIGPAPCFYTRIAGMYRWHLIVRGDSPLAVVRAVALETDWYIDVDPIDLL
jgi:primosomal protein N' (replication factor Y)